METPFSERRSGVRAEPLLRGLRRSGVRGTELRGLLIACVSGRVLCEVNKKIFKKKYKSYNNR